MHEPEFAAPSAISGPEVRSKLEELGRGPFFESPRTASEAVGLLRERGWVASPLDVSRTLARMALQRQLTRRLQNNRSYYSARGAVPAR